MGVYYTRIFKVVVGIKTKGLKKKEVGKTYGTIMIKMKRVHFFIQTRDLSHVPQYTTGRGKTIFR